MLPSNRFTFNIDTGQYTNWPETHDKYHTHGNNSLCGCLPWNTGVDRLAKKREGWWIPSSFSHIRFSSPWDKILYLTEQYTIQSKLPAQHSKMFRRACLSLFHRYASAESWPLYRDAYLNYSNCFLKIQQDIWKRDLFLLRLEEPQAGEASRRYGRVACLNYSNCFLKIQYQEIEDF